MVACLSPVQEVVGSNPGRVEPKTLKLVFAASPLSMWHKEGRVQSQYNMLR